VCRGGPALWDNGAVSDHSGYPGAPPGWYSDPAGGPGQRWWDGYAWSEATVLPQQPPTPPAAPPWAGAGPPLTAPTSVAPWAVASERLSTFNTAGHVNDEIYLVSVARFAVVAPAVYFFVWLLTARANAAQLRSIGDQFRVDWHDSQNGITPPPYHATGNGFSPLVAIVGLVALAAVVLCLVWQHRAASAGRALGIPSSCSPAWGVGSWFVPFVNFWIPYTAIRDCLPAGHPARPRILRWWLALVAAFCITVAACICAFFSSGVALVVSIPAALACVAIVALAPGIVTAIASCHREALAKVTAEAAALTG
jgi:hypothetical protein